MTKRPSTVRDALRSLKPGITDTELNTAELAGQTPLELQSHIHDTTYVIQGVTPSDFIKDHGATAFDFQQLMVSFKKICHDYGDPLAYEATSKAVEFCAKIIFEVGPKARAVTKGSGDKTWTFKFAYATDDKAIVKTAYVSTFKGEGVQMPGLASETAISLTIKQAGMLAVVTFGLVANLAYKVDNLVLQTPLCGAIFNKDEIVKMAIDLEAKDIGRFISDLNISCQSGGQYIDSSVMYLAAVAVVCATRAVKDDKIRYSIIGKTLKQYHMHKKPWDLNKFTIASAYAHGGLPRDMDPHRLIDLYDQITIKASDKQRALQQSILQTRDSEDLSKITFAYDTQSLSKAGVSSNQEAKGATGRKRASTDEDDMDTGDEFDKKNERTN